VQERSVRTNIATHRLAELGLLPGNVSVWLDNLSFICDVRYWVFN